LTAEALSVREIVISLVLALKLDERKERLEPLLASEKVKTGAKQASKGGPE